MIIQSFRLEKHLVGFAVGEALYLILDGRAVTRPLPGNLPVIDRRQMQGFRNDPVSFGRCTGNTAANLGNSNMVGQCRKRYWRVVCRLHFQRIPVNGPAIEPRRCACLQPANRQVKGTQPFCQRVGWRLANPASRSDLGSQMDQTSQKGPSGQYHSCRAPFTPILGDHTAAAAILDDQITDRRLDDGHAGIGNELLDRLAIEFPVGLSARTMNRGTAGPVQHPELNTCLVDRPAHNAVERIDLAHQMAFAKSADGRVAGHLADPVSAHRHKGCLCTHACGSSGRFAARMPSTDNDDVKLHGAVPSGHSKSVQGRFMRPLQLFSNAKAGKYAAKQLFGVNLPGDSSKAVGCASVVFSRQLGRNCEIVAQRRFQ